ncbi:MAG: hypothetical protein ACE1Z6_10140 [Candidatus Methylomirabilales bacterium]
MPSRRRRVKRKFLGLVVVLCILVALTSLGVTWFMQTVCTQLYTISGAGLEELLQKAQQERQKR